jgi:hypothetical protein
MSSIVACRLIVFSLRLFLVGRRPATWLESSPQLLDRSCDRACAADVERLAPMPPGPDDALTL